MSQNVPVVKHLEPPGARSTIDLLDLFWRRRTYVIWSFLLGLVLGVLYCGFATPMYESTADVLVVAKRPGAVTGDRQYESGFEDYLATHLAIIVSPVIVERAIEASDLGSLECFADVEDPEENLVETIIGQLEVEGGSRDLGESADSIMTLAFRGHIDHECPVVVQALLDSYETFHHEVYRGMSDDTVDLISQARDLLKTDLAGQEASYSKFRQTSPLVARGTDEVNPLQDRLTTIEEQRSELLLREAEIQRQLLALQRAKEDGSDYQQLLAMVSELRQLATIENDLPGLSSALESQLIQLVDDEQRLLEHYGPGHPHILMVRQRIATTRRLFALPTTAHMQERELVDDATLSATSDPIAIYTQYLEQELKRLQISQELLTDLYDREHNDAKQLGLFQLQDESFQRGIERTEALYEVVINRLQEASLIKDFGGFETRVIAPPRLGVKVSPSRRILLPVTAFAGMLLGCMLAIVAELRDDGFQSCEQLERQMGLPVIGQIPHCHAIDSDIAIDPMLCAYHQPRSVPAESYRALRTALFYNGLNMTRRVIQVTGAGAQDGASTVAANLAISVAQTGKRVLLIDANLRNQRQHELFGIAAPEKGLASLVGMDVDPDDVLLQTAVNNLSLLPAEKPPEGPCEWFTSPRFGELINLFRDSFDCVLIDTEPLLAASDPCVIASNTDGMILTLSLTRGSRVRAQRAKEILDRHDVQLQGVVINRISGTVKEPYKMEGHDYGRHSLNTPAPRAEQNPVRVGR